MALLSISADTFKRTLTNALTSDNCFPFKIERSVCRHAVEAEKFVFALNLLLNCRTKLNFPDKTPS